MDDDESKAAADRWLGLMLVECSYAFLGWSYAKTKSKDLD